MCPPMVHAHVTVVRLRLLVGGISTDIHRVADVFPLVCSPWSCGFRWQYIEWWKPNGDVDLPSGWLWMLRNVNDQESGQSGAAREVAEELGILPGRDD